MAGSANTLTLEINVGRARRCLTLHTADEAELLS